MSGYTLEAGPLIKVLDGYADKLSRPADVVNEYLWNDGAELIKRQIVPLIPVSDRNKEHAAYGMPINRQKNGPLSVTLEATGRWGYLIFPDEGRGEHNNTAHEFMYGGAEAAMGDIVSGIEESFISKLGG